MLEAVERGHEPCSALSHHLRAFIIEHRAVFDGVYASADGSFDADGAFSMCHNFTSGAVRDFDGTRHLLVTQLLYAVITDRVHDTASRHELDPVCTVLNVAAHDAAHVVHGISRIWLL